MDFNICRSLADVNRAIRTALVPKYGEREAAAMARIILTTLKNWSLTELLANEEREASDFIKGRSEEIVGHLLRDMPLQYALGETVFYGLKLKVAPGVLIPRPETEQLVDIIVKENTEADLNVLDLCCGSGAIAVALARNLPFSRVEAIDISPKAVALSKENASALKTRISISREDIFNLELPCDYYDIIVSNPPYVDESEKADMEANVLQYEPHEAIFVPDENPLLFYKRIASLAVKALKGGGRLYLEINPRHAAELKTLLQDTGFIEVSIIKDIHGIDRFASASTPS